MIAQGHSLGSSNTIFEPLVITHFPFQVRAVRKGVRLPAGKDARLKELARTVPVIMTKSLAINTLKSYNQGFRAWLTWSCMYEGVDTLPIKSVDLAFFFTSIIQQNGRYGKIEQAFYGINWLHNVLGMPNPCESKMVLAVKEAAKRILKRPTVKKCPIQPQHLQCIVLKYGETNNLLDIRVCAIALVSYAGFLRYDEVSSIRSCNLRFERTYFKIFIESSKTDQEGAGDIVYIARTGLTTCPYNMIKKYLHIAKLSTSETEFIFRPVVRTKQGHRFKKVNKPISYTTARDTVMDAVQSIGLDRKLFGLHSFRRGGATESAKRGCPDRLFKKHGRWKSDNAKDGYVSEDVETRLLVSKNLGI